MLISKLREEMALQVEEVVELAAVLPFNSSVASLSTPSPIKANFGEALFHWRVEKVVRSFLILVICKDRSDRMVL